MSLIEYAKKASVKKCAVCELDAAIVKELNEGRAAGVSIANAVKWLQDEKKKTMTAQKLRAHYAHAAIEPPKKAPVAKKATAAATKKPATRTAKVS